MSLRPLFCSWVAGDLELQGDTQPPDQCLLLSEFAITRKLLLLWSQGTACPVFYYWSISISTFLHFHGGKEKGSPNLSKFGPGKFSLRRCPFSKGLKEKKKKKKNREHETWGKKSHAEKASSGKRWSSLGIWNGVSELPIKNCSFAPLYSALLSFLCSFYFVTSAISYIFLFV